MKRISRSMRRTLIALVAAMTAMVGGVVVVASSPAAAATNQFRGMNWAQLGDNFSTSPLVVQGLSQSDSYATVQAKANALYDDMASTMGINTVRLPINTQTVANTTWWNAYRGAIDAATARGFKVILAFWTDHSSGARIANLAAWNTMWSSVTSAYGSNTNVYFEPMNEPGGYSSAQWRDIAANWLSTHYSAVPSRVLIGGTGASQDLRDICNDSRFNSTLLSFHHYAFFYGSMTYDAWRSHMQTRLGNCASRAVATEFGGPMDNGLNYADANSTDNFVRHIRAMAQVMRDNQMGGTYWPALGGKNSGSGHDWYSMFALSGSGTNLNLTIRNTSGADRIRYAYGDTIGGGDPTTPPPTTGTFYRIDARHSGKAMDVQQPNTDNGARVGQYTYSGGAWQQWQFQDAGSGYWRIVSRNSGKCLDVVSASTADGAELVQYTCGTGTNQQFQMVTNGGYFQLRARHSNKCVDVPAAATADGVVLKQYSCNSGTNQQWSRTTV
ncbi:RICIN domain-containing protein [Micromonospora sp. NBC_00362]|uniref:RICIN domain-containing protein n=1 Tax=unclassified Micromonospora TaxID=2617518 RepID=UPI00225564FC|nr:RICIN domain-containing protein [Micromonospora sp. NBC_00362]MCX5115675.1 RICIN domain-containing protein [Micromonospora sp. NBC_00362]WTI06002.1 RICIN domain-containing protein [Micromonospora sp. NBC_00821]